MTTSAILLILLVLALPALLVFAVAKDYRDGERRAAERAKEDARWLSENATRHKVRFYTRDGEFHVSGYLESDVLDLGRWSARRTSHSRATQLMENMYDRGFFTDYEGVTYPVAEVVKAEVTTGWD